VLFGTSGDSWLGRPRSASSATSHTPYCPTSRASSSRLAPPCLPSLSSAAVHGIALAVRAGASGKVYCWAVSAVAAIGAGAFMLSFRALRDLLIETGTPPTWAWIFPAIVDTAVGVSTLMLVALGDKPVRRARPGPCPFRWAWACRLDGKTPDSRPLHIPAPDPGPWQTRQCPVEDLRLRAESSLAAVGWGVRRDRKSRTDLDVVDVRQLPVPPLLAAHVGGELGGHRRLGSG